MRRLLSGLIAIAPLAAIAYFTRIGESSIYVFDALAGLLLVVAAFTLNRHRLVPFAITAFVLVLAATAGFLFSSFSAHDLRLDQFIAAVIRYVQFISVLGCVAVATSDPRIPRYRHAGRIFVVAVFVPLIYGLAALWIDRESVLVFGRLASYLTSPNFLGAYICISIPPMTVYLTQMRGVSRALVGSVFYACVVTSLFFAGSNSGWILSGAALIVSLFAVRRYRTLRIVGALAVIMGTVAVGMRLQPYLLESEVRGLQKTGALVGAVVTGDDVTSLGSGQLRETLARETLELAFSRASTVAVGVGLGQSPAFVSPPGLHVTAHNGFVVLLAETGVIGLVSFLTALVLAGRAVRVSAANGAILMGYLLAMLGTPHVYLPFLWGSAAFGLYVTNGVRPRAVARDDRRKGVAPCAVS